MKLIKARDGTFKCSCRSDFVIMHNKEVQCAYCGGVAGYLHETPGVIIDHDSIDLTNKELMHQIQFNNNLISYLEAGQEGVMNPDKNIIEDIKANIRALKKLE